MFKIQINRVYVVKFSLFERIEMIWTLWALSDGITISYFNKLINFYAF